LSAGCDIADARNDVHTREKIIFYAL